MTNSDTYTNSTLPEYQSHKKVKAGKIIWVNHIRNELKLSNEEIVQVTREWMDKHLDEMPNSFTYGDWGYYVMYKDGYTSWSPTEAFEQGNTPVEEISPTLYYMYHASSESGDNYYGGVWIDCPPTYEQLAIQVIKDCWYQIELWLEEGETKEWALANPVEALEKSYMSPTIVSKEEIK